MAEIAKVPEQLLSEQALPCASPPCSSLFSQPDSAPGGPIVGGAGEGAGGARPAKVGAHEVLGL